MKNPNLLFPGPAYRIVTPRLVIRCWDPRDAVLLKEAVDSSIEHLRTFLPWAEREPTDLNTKIALLRSFRGKFDLGQDFTYGIFSADETRVIGGTGLHTRPSSDAREIGYWIRAGETQKGYASETAAALTRVAFEVDGVSRVEIHMDVANEASRAVPRRLGYTRFGMLRRSIPRPSGDPSDRELWALIDDEYPASPCASAEVQAFDVAGRRLW